MGLRVVVGDLASITPPSGVAALGADDNVMLLSSELHEYNGDPTSALANLAGADGGRAAIVTTDAQLASTVPDARRLADVALLEVLVENPDAVLQYVWPYQQG